MTALFDSHAHLAFLEDEGSILERARKANVTRIMNIAVDAASFEKGLLFQKQYSSFDLFLAAATTPHDVTSSEDPFFAQVEKAAKEGLIRAIGECGLEYFHTPQTKDMQQQVFLRYAQLSATQHLPLIVHCRVAFSDLFVLLKDFSDLKGVLHCFTGTYEDAKALLDRGWYISLSGIITFPKSIALQNVVKQLPLEQLLVETDSPYLAPQNFRGKKNEPSLLPEIVAQISSLKQISFEEVAAATFRNASKLFQIS
jgi:TatD DNase family protein